MITFEHYGEIIDKHISKNSIEHYYRENDIAYEIIPIGHGNIKVTKAEDLYYVEFKIEDTEDPHFDIYMMRHLPVDMNLELIVEDLRMQYLGHEPMKIPE